MSAPPAATNVKSVRGHAFSIGLSGTSNRFQEIPYSAGCIRGTRPSQWRRPARRRIAACRVGVGDGASEMESRLPEPGTGSRQCVGRLWHGRDGSADILKT